MALISTAIKKIEGPLVFLEPIPNVKFDEVVQINTPYGKKIMGRTVLVSNASVVVEVFRGTQGLDLGSTSVEFSGDTIRIPLSEEMISRTFNGIGQPIDGGPEPIPEAWNDINGDPINPFAREYPRELIETGIAPFDILTTAVCGQKLPIFSGQGLPHDEIAARIVKQAKILSKSRERQFLIIFAGIGIKNDTALFFRESFVRTASKGLFENNFLITRESHDGHQW